MKKFNIVVVCLCVKAGEGEVHLQGLWREIRGGVQGRQEGGAAQWRQADIRVLICDVRRDRGGTTGTTATGMKVNGNL